MVTKQICRHRRRQWWKSLLAFYLICFLPLTCFANHHKAHIIHAGPVEIYIGAKPPIAFVVQPPVIERKYFDKEVFGSDWLPSWIIFWARPEQTHIERIDCAISFKRKECNDDSWIDWTIR